MTVRYGEALLQAGRPKRAHEVLLDLFNNVPPSQEQIRLTAIAANAAGDVADAYSYMAEYHLMGGDLPLAINQLELALSVPGLSEVQRAKFVARLKEIRECAAEGTREDAACRTRSAAAGRLKPGWHCRIAPAALVPRPGDPDARPPAAAPRTLAHLLCGSCCSPAAPRPASQRRRSVRESANRSVYAFNDGVDRAALKPIAQGYVKVTPAVDAHQVSNFFTNLEYPTPSSTRCCRASSRQPGRTRCASR